MRDYGRVYSSFWTSADVRPFSDDGKLLALYLLSNSHGTIAGVGYLPDGYVCDDINWQPVRVSEGFTELSRKGFANRCETTNWVWVTKFFDWNRPHNPNQWKAARKIAGSVPAKCSWHAAFMQEFAIAAGDFPKENPNPLRTVPQTVTKGSPSESGSEINNRKQNQESASASASASGSDARTSMSLQERVRANGNHGAKP
jgi:hypothetical protein